MSFFDDQEDRRFGLTRAALRAAGKKPKKERTMIIRKIHLLACNISAPNLKLEDCEVNRLLGPFVFSAVDPLEKFDVLVGKLEITPEYVRAFPQPDLVDRFEKIPTFVQKDLPKGLHAACVDLSVGPTHPFPEPEVKPRINTLAWKRDFKMLYDDAVKKAGAKVRILVQSNEFLDIFKYWGRIDWDPCTERELMLKGYQGKIRFPDTDEWIELWSSRKVKDHWVGFQAGDLESPFTLYQWISPYSYT